MREWSRVDLAVLGDDLNPQALLEVKAADTVDVHWNTPSKLEFTEHWKAGTYLEGMLRRDAAKMALLAPEAVRFSLVIISHIFNPADLPKPLRGKYGRGRLKGIEAKQKAQEKLVCEYLRKLSGQVTRHCLGAGEYLDTRVELVAYLAGPLANVAADFASRRAD